MGEEDVRDLDPAFLGLLQQGPKVVVAVDQHPRAAHLVGDEVGIGEPLGILGARDDQNSLLLVRSRHPTPSLDA